MLILFIAYMFGSPFFQYGSLFFLIGIHLKHADIGCNTEGNVWLNNSI
jgi:hypothetical protein